MTRQDWFCALIAALLCLGAGAVSSLATTSQIASWYAGLVRPSWTPPDLAFPIVWTLLYALMAVTLFLVWRRSEPSGDRSAALALFGLQLALNAVWSPVFFGLHRIIIGLIIITALLVVLAATVRATLRVHRLAGLLLLPYLAWVAYATSLNAGIAWLNP